ncbi:hypothetical protein Tco_0063909, partial [Tanacetum coccineum]
AHDENVRTRPALDRFVIFTSSSEHADTHTLNSPQVASPTPRVQSETKAVAAGMVNEVEGSSVLGNQTGTSSSAPGDASRNLVDHVPPPGYWASLRNQNDVEFLDRLNQRDTEIANLKLRLERLEGKAAEVGKFCGQVSRLEAAAAAKAEQFVGLSVQNAKLPGKVSGFDSVRDGLKEKVAQLESECECLRGKVEGEAKLKEQFLADVEIQRLAKRGLDLDAHLSKLSYQVDSELYPHMLTDVAGCRWVIGHDLHLAFMKCCQSLDYQTTLATVISLAINQGIQQGLEAG